jgi:hypothetical protein
MDTVITRTIIMDTAGTVTTTVPVMDTTMAADQGICGGCGVGDKRGLRLFEFALSLVRLDTLTNCFENRLVNFLSRDIAIREVDGGEVAARIESDPALHRTPVVFLTAVVTKAEARSSLEIQGYPFPAKPISIPGLVAGIERNLPARNV